MSGEGSWSPLHCAEITQRILDDGRRATAGATPAERRVE